MTDSESPSLAGEPNRWAKQIQDIIADSGNLREGLSDDEAMPLIDWGANRAIQLGDRLGQPDQAELTDEQIGDMGYALVRLMTRIAWLVVYRNEKDVEWLTRTFHKINDLSQELDGVNAPELSDDEITAWISQHAQYSDTQLIHDLIARLTPKPPAPPAPPPKPDTPTLLSSILDANGSIKPADAPPKPDMPAPLSSILDANGSIKPADTPPKPDTPAPLSSILDANGSIKPPDSPPSPQGEKSDDQEKKL